MAFSCFMVLYRGDNLDAPSWEKENLSLLAKDERLNMLKIAYSVASRII